jgi:hypothetical protein
MFRRFKEMFKKNSGVSSFNSFESFMEQIMRILAPINILEFGPGISTRCFLKYSNANIVSFETNDKWFKKYFNEFKNSDRVTLIKKKENWNLNEIFQIGDIKYNFILVDAGNRIEELWFCKKLLKENGVIMLHDSHRNDYYWGIKQYRHCFFFENHSCLLTNNKNVYEELIREIKSDYSCSCKYCSSDYRKEYFKEFMIS